MKKPNIHLLAQHAKDAFVRFPWVILSALLGSLAGMYWIQVSEVSPYLLTMINLMLTAALGIPLFFSIQMLLERAHRLQRWAVLMHLLAFLVLGGIYWSLPGQDTTQNTFQPYFRYAIYNVCLHLFVAFSPFLTERNDTGFWAYNMTLLIRILAALLYALILFLGIVMALLAVHLLFDLNIDSKVYPQLFILIMGLFNTWIFLAGIPSVQDNSLMDRPPKELRIFTQYVLLPLLLIYLLILYGYGIKIISSWDWPRGIVSYLVICVCVLGLGTSLLLYPYGRWTDTAWIRKADRIMYVLLLPLLILLFLAVGIRLGDYGVTVNRYLVLVLGIWLAGICLYFSFGGRRIIVIPVSLSIMFFLASWGPWGAFSVSERQQIQRLKQILTQNNLLIGDSLRSEVIWDAAQFPHLEATSGSVGDFPLSDSLYREVFSIIHYLDDYHGFDGLDSWFSQDMDQVLHAINQHKLKWQKTQESELYLKTMGLRYAGPMGTNNGLYYSFQLEGIPPATAVRGFDYVIAFQVNEFDHRTFSLNGSIYQLKIDATRQVIILATGGQEWKYPLDGIIDNLISQAAGGRDKVNYILQNPLVLEQEDDHLILKFEIYHVNFQELADGQTQLRFISGNLLIREK